MPKRQFSLAESMFGTEESSANYVTLTASNGGKGLFDRPPKTLLDMPNVLDPWHNDFQIEPGDFTTRFLAMSSAYQENAEAMKEPFDDGTPHEWTLVFRLGGWHHGYLHHSDCCQITIDTTIALVYPTKEEIKRFCGKAGKAGAA